jgi:hypothetical protein
MTVHFNTKPPLTLTGEDGNAFSILGRARRAARSAGESDEQIAAFTEDAKRGDYDHLLRVVIENFEVE